MSRLTERVIIAVLVLLFALVGAAYWFCRNDTQKPPDIVSISRFDPIFSKDIKRATDMADLPALREVSLNGDDLEVRIWRTQSLPTLEGVLLRHIDGDWSGLHLRFRTDEQGEIQGAEVEQLKTPVSGWRLFWGELVGTGIMLLPFTPENECDTRYIDGIIYFVEISQNGTYRNYQYSGASFECRESKQMPEIGEIIGLAFDSGQEKCTQYEWFACMRERKAQSVASPK